MASSRKRGRDAGSDETASAGSDRLTLHVGGETFITYRSTLEPASSYFGRRFSAEWSSDVPRDIFLDRDADAFRVLLSYMCSGHVSVLPREPALFARVLLDAEFFGVDSLIDAVKVRVQRHLHPSDGKHTRTGNYDLSDEERTRIESLQTAAAFDEEHGGLHAALDSTWFVDRFFTPEPPSLYPKIVQLVPAQKTNRVVISGGYHMGAQPKSRSVRAFALVEDESGQTGVLPMVATSPEDVREDLEDDETEEDVKLAELEPVTVIDNAEVYGWWMDKAGDVRPHGQPN